MDPPRIHRQCLYVHKERVNECERLRVCVHNLPACSSMLSHNIYTLTAGIANTILTD